MAPLVCNDLIGGNATLSARQTVEIGANGAEIGSICREAAMNALRDAADLSAREDIHLVRHCHVYIALKPHEYSSQLLKPTNVAAGKRALLSCNAATHGVKRQVGCSDDGMAEDWFSLQLVRRLSAKVLRA